VTGPAAASHGVKQGVVWTIPRKMSELHRGQLTGSLALIFIPTAAAGRAPWTAQTPPVLAHAAYAVGKEY
jgi:hypothetical protein